MICTCICTISSLSFTPSLSLPLSLYYPVAVAAVVDGFTNLLFAIFVEPAVSSLFIEDTELQNESF